MYLNDNIQNNSCSKCLTLFVFLNLIKEIDDSCKQKVFENQFPLSYSPKGIQLHHQLSSD